MFRFVPIVEGDGEVLALPILLGRVITYIDPNFLFCIERPIRLARGKFDRQEEFSRFVELAARRTQGLGAVIILLDADDDCPAQKGPELLNRAQSIRTDCIFKAILANKEFEAWYLASAQSLAGKRGLPDGLVSPTNPENIRNAKGWLAENMPIDQTYSPTVDQAAFARIFDISMAIENSESFDKFVRDIRSIVVSN